MEDIGFNKERDDLSQPWRLESDGHIFLNAYSNLPRGRVCFICKESIASGEKVAVFCNFPEVFSDIKFFFSHIRCLTDEEIFYISYLFQMAFIRKLPDLISKEHKISQYIWTEEGILMEIYDYRNCRRMPLDKFLIRIQFYCDHCQLRYNSFINLETGYFEILPDDP